MGALEVGARSMAGGYDFFDAPNGELEDTLSLLEERGHEFIQTHTPEVHECECGHGAECDCIRLTQNLFGAEVMDGPHFVRAEVADFLNLSKEEKELWVKAGVNPAEVLYSLDVAEHLKELCRQAQAMNWYILSLCRRIAGAL